MKPRPWGLARGIVQLLVVCCLSAFPAGAEERFHLFPGGEIAPATGLRVQLEGLPPAAPLEALVTAPARSATRHAALPSVKTLPPYPTQTRFGWAVAEVVALDAVTWALDRYASEEPWAFISMDTVRYNLQTGFTWDNDPFTGNQASHSYHGSAYFNAARTNGFSFWESGAFTFGGSFLWEMFLENQPPSINDLVNTTLGGMVWGEGLFRLGNMVLDNRVSGFERFAREAGGLVLNPIGGLNRLLRGEMWTDFENPTDRFPSRLYFELDGVYRHGSEVPADGADEDQAGFSFLLRYGDPFNGDHPHPFDFFDFRLNLVTPHATLVTEIVGRGLLADWTLSDRSSAEQRLGLFLGSSYFNNEQAVYAAQVFSANHQMRVPLGRESELRTEASVLGMPIVALGVDYRREGSESLAGRTYDYGPGYGVQASARIRRREIDLVVLAWSLNGLRKASGISKSSRIQSVSAEARLPLTRNLVVGGGWTWGERTTTYDELPTVSRSGTAWRLFAGLALPSRPGPQEGAGEAGPASSPAALGARWSLTAFAGGFFGTRVKTAPEVNVVMGDAPAYGLRLGYQLTRVFSLEAGWSRASSKLEPRDPETGASVAPTSAVTSNSYELDGLFGFGGPAVRGYAGIGAGIQNLSPSVPSLDPVPPTTRLSANAALGGFWFLTPRFAVRADGRYRFMATDNRIGAVVCDPKRCTTYATNLFSNAELTGGLTVRF